MTSRYQVIRAARGPILLILIGTLFLMQQMRMAEFGRTWPILLITIGVLKLLERMAAPPIPAPEAYPVYQGNEYPGSTPPGGAYPASYSPGNPLPPQGGQRQ